MEAAGSAPMTLVFVDIDGVLNVGIRDMDSPIMFNDQNCELARKYRHAGSNSVQVEKVLAVMEGQRGSNEAGATLRALACRGSDLCSEPLVARLAAIISAATAAAGIGAGSGANTGVAPPTAGRLRVVLASNWRRSKYSDKVRGLEQLLSRQLNRPFAFDDSTGEGAEKHAADRLRCIGDYVKGFCPEALAAEGECGAIDGGLGALSALRVLVLDDFFITPMKGWECDGTTIRSVNDAEAYLKGCAPSWAKVSVRILHPFAEWTGRSGVRIQIGTGLTQQHCHQAAAFLSSSDAAVAAASAVQQLHYHCQGSCMEEEQCLEGGAGPKGPLFVGSHKTLVKLPVLAANFLRGKAQSGLTSSLPVEYFAGAFFVCLAFQSLIYST